MAKKTTKKSDTNVELSQTSKNISEDYGEGIVLSGTSLIETPREVISVGPRLDEGLGGGFQVGSLVTMSGAPRCGKTTTALHFAGRWQKTGRKVVYLNAEHRLQERDLKGIPRLVPENMEIIQSRKGRILSAQDFLVIAEKYLSQETGICLIIDSISMLCEEKELVNGLGTETRGGSGKIIASWIRRMTAVIPTNEHIVICIAHLYANTSGQGKKWIEAMGGKVNYALSTKMQATHIEPITVGTSEDAKQIGQTVFWNIERTPLGPPKKKVGSIIRYGAGIDEISENIELGVNCALIAKTGAWFTLNFLDKPVKLQGAEKVYDYLSSNPDAAEKLDHEIREMMAA